jgi:Xaa-Pro aminopeptidase
VIGDTTMSPHPLTARHHAVLAALPPFAVDGLVVSNLSNIRYLTGFGGSAGLLVVTPARLYLLVDFRYSAAVESLVRTGVAPPAIEVVHLEGSAGYDRRFADLVAAQGWRRLGFEAGHVSVGRWRRWAADIDGGGGSTAAAPADPAFELVETEQVIEAVRARKDAQEIGVLRDAARRLSAVARTVLDEVVRAGRTELEIAADIDWRIKRAGFERTAFETIVASGPNSALPHAHPTPRRLEAGDLVVLDFGGVQDGYCVDLTRTVGIGRVPDAARRIYEAVQAAHAAAVEAAGGVDAQAGDVDAAARNTLRAFVLEERRADGDETIGPLDGYFGHGTGHGLGLDVHELPRLSRRTAENPGTELLEPGMVFTIEPGAYVEGIGGVRIEDDLLRTAAGVEMLTDVPREWKTIAV